MNYFQSDPTTPAEAKAQAHRLAFAPLAFQACRVLRDRGILQQVFDCGAKGLTMEEIRAQADLHAYGVKILLEAGLGIGLFYLSGDRFRLTKLGYMMLRDPMTRVNMDVVHHVCYRGFFDLEKSLVTGRPEGLKALGDWSTLYEGLSSFTPIQRDSWLAFDHFYSDMAFPAALPQVFSHRPNRLLDVGGNTGKWAVQCAKYDPAVRVTIADLPQQLELARTAVQQLGLKDRIEFHSINLLDESASLPPGHDVIWMSQFLDCFSQPQIISILQRTAQAMGPDSLLFILDLFWDRQPNETAAFCLQQTSLYFACIANGNSQMYHSQDMLRCLEQSGLKVIEDRDGVGAYHTLLTCRKA